MDSLTLLTLKNKNTGDIKKQWLNQNRWEDTSTNHGTCFTHTTDIESKWGHDDQSQGKFQTLPVPLQPSIAVQKPKTSDCQPLSTRFDTFGIIRPGSWVQQGSTLVGKRKRALDIKKTPEEQLLYDIFTSSGKNVRQKGGGKTTELWTHHSTAIEGLRDSPGPEGKAITGTTKDMRTSKVDAMDKKAIPPSALGDPKSPWGESTKLSFPHQEGFGEQWESSREQVGDNHQDESTPGYDESGTPTESSGESGGQFAHTFPPETELQHWTKPMDRFDNAFDENRCNHPPPKKKQVESAITTDSTSGIYDITENGQFKDTSFVLSHDVDARVLQTYFFPDANASVAKPEGWKVSPLSSVSAAERERDQIAHRTPQAKAKGYDRWKGFKPSGDCMCLNKEEGLEPSATGLYLNRVKGAPKSQLQQKSGGQWERQKQWQTLGTDGNEPQNQNKRTEIRFEPKEDGKNSRGITKAIWHWDNGDNSEGRREKHTAVESFYHHQKKKSINRKAISGNESKQPTINEKPPSNTGTVMIYLIVKRPIEIGDKLAGRHGNKGIVSNVLPEEDMPYLSDGTPLEILLNPLGVPSRMNVGQVYECLLGMAGAYLNEHYRLKPFDESYGDQTSRAFVYSKLFQASRGPGETGPQAKANSKQSQWIFHGSHPGKTKVFDGRSGEVFQHPMTVGVSYIMKLVHLVDEKMHARSTGPYSLITQQPLKGRSKHGGQRLGEMEVWAFESFGASYLLQEMMTLKSDDIYGRNQAFRDILRKNPVKQGSIPESFRVLAYELRALCFDVFYTPN